MMCLILLNCYHHFNKAAVKVYREEIVERLQKYCQDLPESQPSSPVRMVKRRKARATATQNSINSSMQQG